MVSLEKEAISALEGGFLQIRKGRRPIGVDRLLGRVVGKQSVSDLVQKKIVPSKFAKRAAEEQLTVPWFVAELAFDILEKTAALEGQVAINRAENHATSTSRERVPAAHSVK